MQSWLAQLKQARAIAVIRSPQLNTGRQMAKAVAAGGMRLIEVTWNSDRPTELIQQLRQDLPDCCIGTGTLLTVADLKEAIAAGAEFCFAPHAALPLIEVAIAHSIPIIPGALTPTEIVTAWQAGATCVKVFPIQAVGGASYLKALRDPLPQIPLIPTGGVNLENAQEFLRAGAIAVGLGGQLFPKEAIERGEWEVVRQRAERLMEVVQCED